MARATTKKEITKVTLEMSYEEASELLEFLEEAKSKDGLTLDEGAVYEALRDVLV